MNVSSLESSDSDGKGCESRTSTETESLLGIESIQNLLADATLLVPSHSEPPPVVITASAESQISIHEFTAIQRIDVKLEQLIGQSARLERERLEIEDLRRKLQDAIQSAETSNADRNTPANNSSGESKSVFKRENDRLINLLATARNEYQALLEFIENDDLNQLASSIRNDSKDRERELCREIELLNEKVALLSEASEDSSTARSESKLEQQLIKLREQLIESRHETVEVRLQCNELSIRLAQYQAPTLHSSESFSWEERKLAWLRQLEHETQVENNVAPSRVPEIEKIIEQTEQEVLRRDKEISDLKSLLQEQSVASNGMAVGAAAISQIIEADDLIIEERQRLKQLQEDWEQKQRQGEIEMSLERAKLARERLELQERMRSLEAMNAHHSADEKGTPTPGKSRGKWLTRLGLRDE
ncbi:MAG: hypothetical protein ACK52L_06670 [Pirellula sp.]